MEQDSPEIFLVENWVRIHSHQNQEPEPQTDDDEALSLCDLATNQHDNPEENHQEKQFSGEQKEEDFAFGGGSNSPESYKMCTADVLFFRGQILPLRHSVTLPMTRTREFIPSVSFSRSEPVSVASSRSSSTRSSASGSEFNGYKLPGNRNQFHSHPSPTPQIRTRSLRHSYPTSSSKWSLLQLGPLKLQEIGLADLKNRSQRSQGRGGNLRNENVKMKRILSFAGCKCSASVIESTVSSRISMVKVTGLNEKETGFGSSKESNVGGRKHAVSSHRTSEWLKQLFVQ
ncbi:hypothetical protein L1987_18109 [Smallanthus sonchifolius]|uniref:Uncharacterized protein n=1 Tax=Smallanthus sonchifolius TaxID=185202 RepID=A0ACB9J2A4_9ASTR|nr:hypothetical protein L1987_18109 [Smallanthus sonchifolius]